MGRGNEQHAKAVVRSACELDDKFLSRLYALWATGGWAGDCECMHTEE